MPRLKILSPVSLGKWVPHAAIMRTEAGCQSATLSASEVFTQPGLRQLPGGMAESQKHQEMQRILKLEETLQIIWWDPLLGEGSS